MLRTGTFFNVHIHSLLSNTVFLYLLAYSCNFRHISTLICLADNLGNACLTSFFVTGAWDHNKLLQSLKAYQNAVGIFCKFQVYFEALKFADL